MNYDTDIIKIGNLNGWTNCFLQYINFSELKNFYKKDEGNKMTYLTPDKIKEIVSKMSERQKYIARSLEVLHKQYAYDYLKSYIGEFPDDYILKRVRSLTNKINKVDKLAQKSKNSILDLKKEKTKILEHVPYKVKKGEWIGVEIECYIPFKSLSISSRDLTSCGECDNCSEENYDNCYGPKLDDGKSWVINELRDYKIERINVKDDSSIDCDETKFVPVEFTVLMLKDNMNNLKRLCDKLNEWNTQVNKSCGLHVHLDCRDLKPSKQNPDVINLNSARYRGKRLHNCLKVLSTLVPKSRRGNSFCYLRMSSKDRYSAINLVSVKELNTIEIRLHSATTDYNKISRWVNLLYDISRCKQLNGNKPQDDLLSVFTILYGNKTQWTKYQSDSFEYFSLRQAKFADTEKTKQNPIEESIGVTVA
jgi:hypothetical protein